MKHFFNIKPAETYRYERAGFWVIVFLEYVIMAASAAFSWGYFSGFLKFTQVNENLSFWLAVALTVLQSVVIGIMLDQLVHSYVFDKWEDRHNYILAACLALMIWDVYANSQGVPELAEMTMKRSAFTIPPYPAQGDYDRVVSELNELKKPKWKGVSVHNAQNNADFAALEAKKALHETQQKVLLVEAQERYAAGLEDDKKIMASAISSMRWANLALYALAIILLLAKENIKKDLAKGKIQAPIEDDEDEDLGNLSVTPTGKVYQQNGKKYGPSGHNRLHVTGYALGVQQPQQSAQQAQTPLQPVATALQQPLEPLQQYQEPLQQPDEELQPLTLDELVQAYSPMDLQALKEARSGVKQRIPTYRKRAKNNPDGENAARLEALNLRLEAIETLIDSRIG